jgi:hypothetical protein
LQKLDLKYTLKMEFLAQCHSNNIFIIFLYFLYITYIYIMISKNTFNTRYFKSCVVVMDTDADA